MKDFANRVAAFWMQTAFGPLTEWFVTIYVPVLTGYFS